MYPKEFRYTREHEWMALEGNRARVGITHYAQDHLGDVVFVELPGIGRALRKGESFGVVESVKTVSDIYAPIGGRVVEVNEALTTSPELINQDPHGRGWMLVVEVENPAEAADLLNSEAYEEYLKEAGH
ncbi:MAG: glycine cleavage system protein GcvH [Firmicutes bacterium]|nr:glycine cleavage system protein GcvH [Bacillota bacterium]MCL5038599.1 glycine cleavage system protein GcvH [Bacillota bacterium]